MPAQIASEPGVIELDLGDKSEFSPGDTINLNVTITANQRLTGRTLIAEILGIEEVDLYGEEDEELDEEGGAVSFNGEDEEFEDEEEPEGNETFSEELILARSVSLQQGESRSFVGEFTLPEDALPTYLGVQATHTWWVDVYLELDGGDELYASKEITVR